MSDSLPHHDCHLLCSSIHGIFQARVLECVAISFSRGSSWPRDRTQGLPDCRQMFYCLSQQEITKKIFMTQITMMVWLWGCRIVWCTLTSWYLVSLLPVSIIHVSVILLVGFWSWEIRFIMWGCRGWGFGFPWNGGIPRPHRVTWSQPINMHPVKSPRESWKARGRLSLNKSPRCLYQ